MKKATKRNAAHGSGGAASVDTVDAAASNAAGNKPGRPGGARSRARILASAGKLFAARGFNGVSTRELARAANVNLGAINYHFGGKRALYHETVCRLIDDIGPLFGPIIGRLREGVADAAGDPVALSRCAACFVESMFVAVLGEQRIHWQMAFLLREFHQPSREFPMLLAERINPMHDAVSVLVAAALGRKPDAPEVLIRAQGVIGQIMSFGAGRNVVCARLHWSDYTRQRIADIASVMIPSILASLGLPEPAGESA